ncbi:uncharacterized protein LOC131164627 [Malania oleifera]|uniref:uncharacterized protein LOC131164627 n=1 Tax=Malania oleifera TaxID=397392 RepID=UPI0025AEA678|nr:uncharacterized protein LOC131164627 [Malania oleifera]
MPYEVDATEVDSVERIKDPQISSLDVSDDDGGSSSSSGDDEDVPVVLGFVEKPENQWSLLRQSFPSKAGGVPAWLDPINLPSGKSCVCGFCGEPLQFLLQVYAPIKDKEPTYHRTIFVFMCPSMTCLLQDQHEQWKRDLGKAAQSVKVFRSQLPLCNPFYSSKSSTESGSAEPSGSGAALCDWCGTWKGDKLCSSCKRARYCSEKHQVLHWRSGHKINCQRIVISSELNSSLTCSGSSLVQMHKVASSTQWPEYEIISEDECESDAEMSTDGAYDGSLVARDKMDETFAALLNSFGEDGDRKCWASFQERIARAPEQVLRYCMDARAIPLWPISSGQPSMADIPKCSYCGGLRKFEFQIMPQLLYYFSVKNEVNSLDWGTIVVYTCEASCQGSLGYKEEFAWVQLASPSATVP